MNNLLTEMSKEGHKLDINVVEILLSKFRCKFVMFSRILTEFLDFIYLTYNLQIIYQSMVIWNWWKGFLLLWRWDDPKLIKATLTFDWIQEQTIQHTKESLSRLLETFESLDELKELQPIVSKILSKQLWRSNPPCCAALLKLLW